VCAAVDVHYLRTGGAQAAAVLAADAAFAHVLAERTAVVSRVSPYRPGEFYLRELPPLRAVLPGLSGLGLLVVDGYADLDPGGRPGLGARAYAEFGIPVIGVAKSRSVRLSTRSRSCADPRCARCSSPPPECPRPTRRTWSGAWPAGTGCPTRCAAPTPSRGQVRPQPP
jgi:deoxyinosine 3'endonuclease (endonuclease V)